jgi:hypothetical protein
MSKADDDSILAAALMQKIIPMVTTETALAQRIVAVAELERSRSLTKQKAVEVDQKINEGTAVAALAREYGTSRQSIMRRQGEAGQTFNLDDMQAFQGSLNWFAKELAKTGKSNT